MPAYIRSAIAATFFLALFIGGATAPTPADEKGVTCPPHKPHFIPKPAPTPAEVDALEGKAPVRVDAGDELRKAQARAAANYHDPASIDLCPPARYVMDGWYGCRPIVRR